MGDPLEYQLEDWLQLWTMQLAHMHDPKKKFMKSGRCYTTLHPFSFSDY
jgi:hypothetical protein